jgi:hypothetical protein
VIGGYPKGASVAPGETLVLHVSTDAPRFRVHVFRWAEDFVPVATTEWMPGRYAPAAGPAADWRWPEYEIEIGRAWPSAVYIAYLEEHDADNNRIPTASANGIPAASEQGVPAASAHGIPAISAHGVPSIAADRAAALFVVRGHGHGGLLYKLPLATYHAYNFTGGGCFYTNPTRSETPPGSMVSLQRPGGGIGGTTWGAVDYYDPSSPRQTFAHWDARFIRWLIQNGYAPEFCTDFDIHADSGVLAGAHLLVSVGHDEYWSEATRDHVEAFIGNGGNVAFFGANLCWWRIHLVDDGRAMVCHQGGPRGALDHWWPTTGAGRPEDALTGVSYRHGGGWWDGSRPAGGYVVQRPDHWVFAGTGLGAGERFGDNCSPPLVGYECDGAPLASVDPGTGLAVLAPSREHCGTPPTFEALAVGVLGADWQELPPREGFPAGGGIHAATMGVYSRAGTVFTAGTTDWAHALASGADPRVATITRNVLDRLLSG